MHYTVYFVALSSRSWKVNITVCVQTLVEYFVTQKLVACMLLSLGMFISVHEMFLLNVLLIFL